MLKGGLCLWEGREDGFLASGRLSQLLRILPEQPYHRQEILEFVKVFLISLVILSFGVQLFRCFPINSQGKAAQQGVHTLSSRPHQHAVLPACSRCTTGMMISSTDSFTEPVASSFPFTNITGEREFV